MRDRHEVREGSALPHHFADTVELLRPVREEAAHRRDGVVKGMERLQERQRSLYA